jgi:acetyl esterase/lipase
MQKCSASTPYPRTQQAPIRNAEFTAIRAHDNIPIGVFYPKFRVEKRKVVDVATLIWFHGGGYTVRTVDEVGNGLRILVESDVHVHAVEYRRPPEWRSSTQLDEYEAVIEWLPGEGGKAPGMIKVRVLEDGGSAGGNMNSDYGFEVETDKKISRSSSTALS